MKTYGGVEKQIYIFFTLALEVNEWSGSRPGRFIPGERAPYIHWVIGGAGPKAGPNSVRKEKYLVPAGNPTPIPRLSRLQRVAIPTELPRISPLRRAIKNLSQDSQVSRQTFERGTSGMQVRRLTT
jgi:hypothetical protein